MQKAQYQKQLQFVQATIDGLNKINFSEINANLEQQRLVLLQGFQGMYALVNAPLLFSSTYKVMKKRYDEWVVMMQETLLNSNQQHGNPLFDMDG